MGPGITAPEDAESCTPFLEAPLNVGDSVDTKAPTLPNAVCLRPQKAHVT